MALRSVGHTAQSCFADFRGPNKAATAYVQAAYRRGFRSLSCLSNVLVRATKATECSRRPPVTANEELALDQESKCHHGRFLLRRIIKLAMSHAFRMPTISRMISDAANT